MGIMNLREGVHQGKLGRQDVEKGVWESQKEILGVGVRPRDIPDKGWGKLGRVK